MGDLIFMAERIGLARSNMNVWLRGIRILFAALAFANNDSLSNLSLLTQLRSVLRPIRKIKTKSPNKWVI